MGKLRSTVTNRNLGIPNFSPQVVLWGDWKKTALFLSTVDHAVVAGYTAAQVSAAKKIKRLVRKKIRDRGGSTPWPEYSDAYREWKESYGYDGGAFYQLTGSYYNNITYWKVGLNNYHVGLKGRSLNPFTGGSVSLQEIAKILEFGTDFIAARPLWRPVYKEFGGAQRLRNLIIWHIRAQIRLKYNVRAKITF